MTGRSPQNNGPAVIVDARGDAPTWIAAGLPLLLRLCRQLTSHGASALRIVSPGESARDTGEGRWKDLLSRGGCPLPLEPLGPDADANAPRLDGAAIYDEDALARWLEAGAQQDPPAPLVTVRRPEDLAAASEAVWRSIRKTLSHDGLVAYYLARPLSRPITRLSARLGLRPNMVSGLGLAVGLGAGVVAALGGYLATLGAALLFLAGLILDCVDGDLARGTLSTSRLGQWLDTITDDLSYVALALGVGVGIYREGGDPLWLWFGLATLALVTLGQAVIYHWLWKSGGPVDTARYPWFFMGTEGLAQRGERTLVGWLSFAVRRDSLTLVFLGLALLGLPWGILLLLFGGSVVYGALLIMDLALAGRTRQAREPEDMT